MHYKVNKVLNLQILRKQHGCWLIRLLEEKVRRDVVEAVASETNADVGGSVMLIKEPLP